MKIHGHLLDINATLTLSSRDLVIATFRITCILPLQFFTVLFFWGGVDLNLIPEYITASLMDIEKYKDYAPHVENILPAGSSHWTQHAQLCSMNTVWTQIYRHGHSLLFSDTCVFPLCWLKSFFPCAPLDPSPVYVFIPVDTHTFTESTPLELTLQASIIIKESLSQSLSLSITQSIMETTGPVLTSLWWMVQPAAETFQKYTFLFCFSLHWINLIILVHVNWCLNVLLCNKPKSPASLYNHPLAKY